MKQITNLTYRMYVLSLRQLSSINKACQAVHSSLEYSEKYFNDPEYRKFIETDKTLIMLDGGTLQDMIEIQRQLLEADINHSYFLEPDLGNCMTSIAFIADERVWDYDYSYETYMNDNEGDINKWIDYIGGEKNVVLKNIIQNKRLSL